MGYALKLVNVDFSDVAVDQVTYIDPVPCTALSLDESTLSFDSVAETKTITATVTPNDTTDTLVWTSSNENVATVANGVVTIHGIGTATITATCGEQTATCLITQTTIKPQYGTKIDTTHNPVPNAANTLLTIQPDSQTQTWGQAYHNDNSVRVVGGASIEIECIPVPYGATKVYVHTSDGVDVSYSYLYYVSTTETTELDGTLYAKYLSRITFVHTNTGGAVEYGQAIMIRPTNEQAATMEYVYFG